MATKTKVKIRLQGHEKFSLREGWLTKGIREVERDPMVFRGKDGPDIFGLGSNMVKSVRYWLKAFGLITEGQNTGATLTDIGKIILNRDPYFEELFTIWILHSNIVKNVEDATAWYMFFNKCELDEFEKEQVEELLHREITKYTGGTVTFSKKSLKTDIDVILNMYSKTREVNDPEDKNISPFVQLNLIKNENGKYFRLTTREQKISAWNILFELSLMMKEKDSIAIDEVISGINGISNIYQISTILANEMLDRLEAMEYIRVNRTAGLDMIYKVKDLTPVEIMKNYYDILDKEQ